MNRSQSLTSAGALWRVGFLGCTLIMAAVTMAPELAAAPVGDAATTSATKSASLFEWRPFLGPFHSLVLHYPIGFLTLAAILEWVRSRKPGADLHSVIRLVIWLSLWTGVISAGLGIIRAAGGGYDTKAVDLHRWYGMAVPVATLVTLWVQKGLGGGPESFGRRWSYRGALLGTLWLLVVAGHYGGNLTHGSKYLVQNAPEFFRDWLNEDSGQPEPSGPVGGSNVVAGASNVTESASSGGGAGVYTQKIRPIFEAKCVQCHGAEKQKGKYRMDVHEKLLAGGSSGKAAVVPGNPLGSELVRMVLLPASHDEVMPPDGKAPLTAEEILAVIHWIQEGAKPE